MKVLLLDNYDSFTYNLAHLLKTLGITAHVYRNDKISLEAVQQYDKILLSPGPGLPSEAGIMPELIRHYAPYKSILGVCLGHQGIGEAFGATLVNLGEVVHGMATHTRILQHHGTIFEGIPERIKTCRYHSWIVCRKNFPEQHLEITAEDDLGHIMALQHKRYDVHGLQFHPESYITEYGKEMLANWLKR
ncbi:MAG: aminodeoxychorismate/anthranilate synthase component II [Cytophagales bacterium]|nr:aminodeoxychorismate/anthranilate synthase component II [Bernardetiaceae bacterium]MDW8211637.1 aminodeoxychorismate/anthranilate synthase component II [Cytophagales bacterium]